MSKLLSVLIIVFTLSRFVGLESSPPGFFSDEAGAAFNMLCPGDDGYKLLFPVATSDGNYSAPFIYIGSVWIHLFGSSVASYRSLGAFFNALAILLIFLLMRRLSGTQTALWSALAASASPWGFQFARFVTDNSMGPFFLAAGLFFLTPAAGGCRGVRPDALRGLVAALCLVTSMYLYPPLRLVTPLVVAVFLALLPSSKTKSFWLSFSFTLLLLLLPLLYLSVAGDAQRRFDALAIWRPGQPVLPAIKTFFENFTAHLGVSYLFLTGDPNLRHSSQSVGLLGPLDVVGLAGLALFRPKPARVAVFLLLALLISLLPGALTNHAIPHSLRTFSGWLFVSMLAGMGLAKVAQLYRHAAPLLLVASTIFFSYFSYCYYAKYPLISRDLIHGFDAEMKDAAEVARSDADWTAFAKKYADYRPDAVRYYLVSFGGMSCPQSAFIIEQSKLSR